MKLHILIMAFFVATGGIASADVVTLVDAVETTSGNINVPTSTNGRLMFKECSEPCEEDFVSVRLTPDTRFYFNGQRLSFVDFRKDFYNLPRGGDNYALITYDTRANIVTRIEIQK